MGLVANAPDINWIEWTNRDGGVGNWWVQKLDGSQIVKLLSFLCTTNERVRHFYSKIMELEFVTKNTKTLRIWNIQGKLVKFEGKLYHIKENLDLS